MIIYQHLKRSVNLGMTRALKGDREERRVMEILINAANILYLLSYFVRDILKLRVLTVIAASMLITYFYCQPEPIMTVVYWNTFFVAQNLFWIVRLARKRRVSQSLPK